MAVNVGTINRMEINKRGAGGIVAQMTIYGDKRQISIVNQNQIRKILSSYYSTIKLSDKTKRTKLSMLPSAFISIKSVYKNNKLDGIKNIRRWIWTRKWNEPKCCLPNGKKRKRLQGNTCNLL